MLPGAGRTLSDVSDEPGHAAGDEINLVVRIWIPDRPGALGLVASRIGALGADIVGLDVLERTETAAVDEFAIVLPRGDLEALLVREIEQVDGASVEECREVREFPDARTDALVSAERLCTAPDRAALLQELADDLRAEFEADWTAVVRSGLMVARSGAGVPEQSDLAAVADLASGSPSTATTAAGSGLPEDRAAASIPGIDATLVASREGRPFRVRERRQLLALARITDLLAARLPEA